MKSLSVRSKITVWFSAVLVATVVLTFVVILSISNSVMQKTVREGLVQTVENNVDEVEFYSAAGDVEQDYDADIYLEYKSGFLEIDDDFLDVVNGISTALYREDGTLLYGEAPLAASQEQPAFSDYKTQHQHFNGITYYTYDRMLTHSGLEGLWLRGTVSEQQGEAQLTSVAKLSLLLLPLLFVLGVLGGWLVAGKSLKPIGEINDLAEQISHGKDLKKRIELGEGGDELHRLADTFNDMFTRLDDAFEAERQFTSDASHELRTPLAVINAQCEYVQSGDVTTEDYEQAIEVINRQNRKMTHLVSDMLDFSRLDRGSDKFAREDVDLSALTVSLCEDLALLEENGITLKCEVQDGIHIIGDRQLLSRLVTNLVMNAYRYGKKDGHTDVTLSIVDGDIQLEVSDDGIGICPEDKDKIFERFYQVDSSRSSAGSGLGLAMVREIARYHGGEMSVLSTQGEGSTFIFTVTE